MEGHAYIITRLRWIWDGSIEESDAASALQWRQPTTTRADVGVKALEISIVRPGVREVARTGLLMAGRTGWWARRGGNMYLCAARWVREWIVPRSKEGLM